MAGVSWWKYKSVVQWDYIQGCGYINNKT